MRCTNCGTENVAGKKFCSQCGSGLASRCPKCASENAPAARSCGDCGAALAGIAEPPAANSSQTGSTVSKIRVTPEGLDATALEGERKTVTALFADIKGSTELEQDLDPEEARAIVDPALKLMIDAVHRYDGYIVQSTGDGIFALFGAPVAHEDHPQRALYAALRMQEELRRYSDKLLADGPAPLEIRVGANTGEVVVRSISTGGGHVEYTPIGHTTNLASRMQTVAPTGSIAITEHTRRLVEGYFALKPRGPTRVKGVSEAVNVYEVTGLGPLRTRLQRSAGRGLTKFVGREREMEAMKAAAERSKSGRGQIVATMAEAGTGKSRLFFEFKAVSQSGWMVLETFSVSHGKASAYLPVIDLLHTYFRIAGEDDQRVRREKVAGRLSILDPSLEDTRPYLFSLLGIVEGDDPLAQMDGQVRKRRTLDAIKRIILRESLNQPLMVIFEDLHWIDEQTQELLNLLADSIGTAKLLLLVNYRPEYSHQWGSKTYYTQLRLDPLGKESAEEMMSALLDGGKDLIPLKRMIIERTEGTPFFMEEIVQSLFDDGVLMRNGTVKLARSMNAVKVPATVQGVLAAHIDRLPAEEKELLQTLGVLGREFPLGLVRSVTLKADDNLNRMLGDLQLAEFIYEQPAVGDTEYTFKHALTQEVSYNSLLIERRKLLHERAGQALESMFAEQLEDHLDELAHHYSSSDNVDKAVEYLGRAGNQAMQRSAYNDAINGLTSAIGLLQRLPDSPERTRRELLLQLAVGPASITIKGWGAQEVRRAYTRARQLCAQLGDPPEEFFPTLYGLWLEHLIRGELPRSYELAEEFLRRANSAQDPALLVYANYVLGDTWYFMGESISAREHLETAIAHYDPERHRTLALRFEGYDAKLINLLLLSWALWTLGYPDQALQRSNEALAFAQSLSNPRDLTRAIMFAAMVHLFRREVRATQESADAVIALSAEHGTTEWLPWATALRGSVMAAQGHHEEGIAQLYEGMAMSRATGIELFRSGFLCLLAEACMQAGRLDHALSALTEAETAANQREERLLEAAEIFQLKGELLLRRDDPNVAEAQRCFERAIEIARKQSAKSLELRARMSLARSLDLQGKRDEARVMLAEIYNWFTEGFDTADLKDAKALLEELTR